MTWTAIITLLGTIAAIVGAVGSLAAVGLRIHGSIVSVHETLAELKSSVDHLAGEWADSKRTMREHDVRLDFAERKLENHDVRIGTLEQQET